MKGEFLPISLEEMHQRGWYYYDFLLITGDAYVDHPSFGTAIISRLLEAEGRAMAAGEDIRHTIISNLDDPDNPRNQRIAVKGVIFDDLTLADWEAAKLGTIEAPFSAESYEILDY